MFAQHPFIQDNHKVVLQQVIRQRDYITEKLCTRLYKACNDLIITGECDNTETHTSLLETVGGDLLATATDERSGIFIQLARQTSPRTGKYVYLMTCGQRWSIEGMDNVNSTTAAKVW